MKENPSTTIIAYLLDANSNTNIPDIKAGSGKAVRLMNMISIPGMREIQASYKWLATDAVMMINVFRLAEKNAKKNGLNPEKWLTPELRKIILDFVSTLEDIERFVEKQIQKHPVMQVIDRKPDADAAAEYRQRLESAYQIFQVQSHITINGLLGNIIGTQTRLQKEEDEERKQLEEELRLWRAGESEKALKIGRQTHEKNEEKTQKEALKAAENPHDRADSVEEDEKADSETEFERFLAEEKPKLAAAKKKCEKTYHEDDDEETLVTSSTASSSIMNYSDEETYHEDDDKETLVASSTASSSIMNYSDEESETSASASADSLLRKPKAEANASNKAKHTPATGEEYDEAEFERYHAKQKAKRAAAKKKLCEAHDDDETLAKPAKRGSSKKHKPTPKVEPKRARREDNCDSSLYDDFNRMNMGYGGCPQPHLGYGYFPPPPPQYYSHYPSGYSPSHPNPPPYSSYPPFCTPAVSQTSFGKGPTIWNVGSGNFIGNVVQNVGNVYSSGTKKRT